MGKLQHSGKPEIMSIDVKDEPISSVLEKIKPSLASGLVYSKSALLDRDGHEHLVTATLRNVFPEMALSMVVESIGFEMDVFEGGHVLVKPPMFKQFVGSMQEQEREFDFDEDDDNEMPF